MLDDDYAALVELSDGELDDISAGKGVNVNLSNLVNINLAVTPQIATQIAVLSANIEQTVLQKVGVSQ